MELRKIEAEMLAVVRRAVQEQPRVFNWHNGFTGVRVWWDKLSNYSDSYEPVIEVSYTGPPVLTLWVFSGIAVLPLKRWQDTPVRRRLRALGVRVQEKRGLPMVLGRILASTDTVFLEYDMHHLRATGVK